MAFQDRAYIPRSLEQSSLYINSEPSYKVPVLLTITPLSTSIFFFFFFFGFVYVEFWVGYNINKSDLTAVLFFDHAVCVVVCGPGFSLRLPFPFPFQLLQPVCNHSTASGRSKIPSFHQAMLLASVLANSVKVNCSQRGTLTQRA